MIGAQELADQFRNGNLGAVTVEVACDGPTALAIAALLDGDELDRLRRARSTTTLIDRWPPMGPCGSVARQGVGRC